MIDIDKIMGMDKVRRKLLMGDELVVHADEIAIGPAVVRFDRPVTTKDVQAILVVYTMGAAAKARLVSEAFDTFVGSFNPVEILGFRGPEEGAGSASEEP